MARDGQGLELSNASAAAVAELDFVREEWLAFGNRFDRFIAAAELERHCLLLPLVAASLMLSMNSPAGLEAARQHLARARAMSAGANGRERAWLGAIDAWAAGDNDRSLEAFLKIVAEWPRDLLAGKLAQLHAFNRGDAETLLLVGERLAAANEDCRFVWAMHAFGLE